MRRPRDPAWVLVRQPSTSRAGQSMPSSSQQSQVHKTQKTGLISAQKTWDLPRSIWTSLSFIWVLLHATTICQTSACTKCAKWISMILDLELHSQNDLVISQLVERCRKMLEELCRWLLSHTTWRHDRQSYCQILKLIYLCCTILFCMCMYV